MNEQLNKHNLIIKKGIINWAIKGVTYKAYVAVVLMAGGTRN
jgi:hypothetical protein